MKIYITKLRLEKGWSMAELARRSGVSVSHISNIENDRKGLTVEVLCKLAKALGVTLDAVVNCEDCD